jgi:hypothetical protein
MGEGEEHKVRGERSKRGSCNKIQELASYNTPNKSEN